MANDDEARRLDRAFLGLDLDIANGRGRAQIVDRLLAPNRRFYGGAGVALAGAAMEGVSERRLRWVTAQFVSTAGLDEWIDLTVEVLAAGRVTAQLRVDARVDDRLLFVALGSTDNGTSEIPDASFGAMPEVADPDDCPPLLLPVSPEAQRIHFQNSDLRDAGSTEQPSLRVWVRTRDHDPSRPAMLGYVADYIPLAIMRAVMVGGGGVSIDNTIRVGGPPRAPSSWVLLELRPQLSSAGFGHGDALLWSQAGELLGIASQTTRLRANRPPPGPP